MIVLNHSLSPRPHFVSGGKRLALASIITDRHPKWLTFRGLGPQFLDRPTSPLTLLKKPHYKTNWPSGSFSLLDVLGVRHSLVPRLSSHPKRKIKRKCFSVLQVTESWVGAGNDGRLNTQFGLCICLYPNTIHVQILAGMICASY